MYLINNRYVFDYDECFWNNLVLIICDIEAVMRCLGRTWWGSTAEV